MFEPKLEDFRSEGLPFKLACMAMESYYLSTIEGARVDKAGFKRFCKSIKELEGDFEYPKVDVSKGLKAWTPGPGENHHG